MNIDIHRQCHSIQYLIFWKPCYSSLAAERHDAKKQGHPSFQSGFLKIKNERFDCVEHRGYLVINVSS